MISVRKVGAALTDTDREYDDAVRASTGPLFAMAFTILRDRGEAEDAVQATMENAWRAWGSLRDPARRRAWLRRICVRECLRSRRRLALWSTTAREPEAAGEAWADNDIDLDAAYRSLSRQQRAVVTLHYQHGYPLDECADLMGCRPGTARSHLARALASMRKELSYD
ncbi:MAG: hypothetical protein QOE92_2627 [Chloroflexota bacterium]|jgi:RNA polymerase sigma factor (sigma-70 family)|nr:hypothetical protein [Chloroflexota bacterium]